MNRWLVPVKVVEYGRLVLVEAETAAEAKAKARMADWVDGGDAASYKITVTGKVEKDES